MRSRVARVNVYCPLDLDGCRQDCAPLAGGRNALPRLCCCVAPSLGLGAYSNRSRKHMPHASHLDGLRTAPKTPPAHRNLLTQPARRAAKAGFC